MDLPQKKCLQMWAEAQGIRVIRKRTLETLRRICETEDLGAGSQGACTLLKAKSHLMVLKKFSKDSSYYEMRDELDKLHKCRGPGVQRLYGVCPKTSEIVSRYAGRSLEKCLKKSKHLTSSKKVYILHKLMKSIRHLLDRNICHNDIKVDNVCVSRLKRDHPMVTLIDLGLSTKMGESPIEATGSSGATLYPHIAPEVLRGKGCSEASEVFSLGYLAQNLFRRDSSSCPDQLDEWIQMTQHKKARKRPSIDEGISITRKYAKIQKH